MLFQVTGSLIIDLLRSFFKLDFSMYKVTVCLTGVSLSYLSSCLNKCVCDILRDRTSQHVFVYTLKFRILP